LPAPPSNRAPQSQAAPRKIGRVTTRACREDLFLQTDPTGYDDGLNWYAYVGNDPLNGTDPSGLVAEVEVNPPACPLGSTCIKNPRQPGQSDQPPPKTPQQPQKPQDTKACAISRKYADAAAEAQLAANGLQAAGLAVAGYGLTSGGKGIRPLTRGASKMLEFYSIAPEVGGFIDSAISGAAAAYATKDPGALGSAVAKFIVTQGSAANFEGKLGMGNTAVRMAIGEGADKVTDKLTPNGCKKK
jgi:hypothetical protein